ncbi:extracellular solute-binding protein [Salinilacihabitans rarus]|uniref:extracellular solute-binding protein n=1 Tax=Salinilacihabitans rarus TaxID=2961596 RepID=UPI0020C8786E|nr:extracellular solute-binding protein [Salinilacihabitans rarus]
MVRDSTGRRDRSRVSRRTFVAAASAAAGGTLAAAGCLGRAADENTVVLSGDTDFEDIMHSEGDAPSVQQALWNAGLDENIRVEVRPGPDDTVQRRSTYEMALEADRSPPDVFMMDSGWTIPFILRDHTLNLEEHLSGDALGRVEEEYVDMAVETARHPGTDALHAVPLFPDFPTIQYRKDLVEDAGYDTADWGTNPLSWGKFADVVADTYSQSNVDYGFTTQAAAYEGLSCCTFNETMTSFGGAYFGGADNLFTAGDRPITVDEEPVLDAIRMMRSFIGGGGDFPSICPSAIVQWTEEEARGPFTGGNAIAHRNWPYSIAINGAEDEFGEDLGVMPVPYGVPEGEAEYEGTGGTAAALGGWHLTVNPHTEKLDRSLQVVEAFTHDEVMLTLFQLIGWLPPKLGLLDEVTPEEAGPVARYVEPIRVAGENAIPRPVTDVWPEQSAVIFQEVHSAYRGVKSPEQAMSDLQTRLEESERDVREAAGGGDGGDSGGS